MRQLPDSLWAAMRFFELFPEQPGRPIFDLGPTGQARTKCRSQSQRRRTLRPTQAHTSRCLLASGLSKTTCACVQLAPSTQRKLSSCYRFWIVAQSLLRRSHTWQCDPGTRLVWLARARRPRTRRVICREDRSFDCLGAERFLKDVAKSQSQTLASG